MQHARYYILFSYITTTLQSWILPKKTLMEAIRMKKVNKCNAVHCMEELPLYSVNKNKMLIISIISIFKIIIFLHYLHILSMISLCGVHGIFFHISLVQ